MTSAMRKTFAFVHRANVDRYQKLLKTNLIVVESEFIERRISEEQKALLKIVQWGALFECQSAA